MIVFSNLSSLELRIAKQNLKEKGQTHLYQDGKMYLVRVGCASTQLVCNRVLKNDLTSNNLGVTRKCALLDKWGYV